MVPILQKDPNPEYGRCNNCYTDVWSKRQCNPTTSAGDYAKFFQGASTFHQRAASSDARIWITEQKRCIRASWDGSDDEKGSGASIKDGVIDKDNWTRGTEISVSMPTRMFFKQDLQNTGCR